MTEKSSPQPAPEPAPNDWRLPADLKAGHVTFRKGCHCSALVSRMDMLHREAFGVDNLTPEQKAENLAALQACKPIPHGFGQLTRGEHSDILELFKEAGEWAAAMERTITPDMVELLGWLTGAANAWAEKVEDRAKAAVPAPEGALSPDQIADKCEAWLQAGGASNIVDWKIASDLEKRAPLTQAAQDVLAERQRQISSEGWTPEHDDQHDDGSLALAAGCYALHHDDPGLMGAPAWWPWHARWWKPKDRYRNLVKAGALIVAELERLRRASKPPVQHQGGANG